MLNKKVCFLILASLFLLPLHGCVLQTEHTKLENEAKRLRQTAEKKDQYIENLNAEIADARKENEKLEANLAQTKVEAKDLEKVIAESKREKKIQQQLITSLKTEIQEGKVEILKIENQTQIRLKDSILFDSGKAKLKPDGIEVLKKLGAQLKIIKDREILIEGHTDNVPLHPRLSSIYSSNLELSAARSLAVARYQIDQIGIPGKRIAVLAYGEHRPIVENDTPEGRRKNRRVSIVLVKLNNILGD